MSATAEPTPRRRPRTPRVRIPARIWSPPAQWRLLAFCLAVVLVVIAFQGFATNTIGTSSEPGGNGLSAGGRNPAGARRPGRTSRLDPGAAGAVDRRIGRRALPYMLLFQILLPCMAPLIDLFALYGLVLPARCRR